MRYFGSSEKFFYIYQSGFSLLFCATSEKFASFRSRPLAARQSSFLRASAGKKFPLDFFPSRFPIFGKRAEILPCFSACFSSGLGSEKLGDSFSLSLLAACWRFCCSSVLFCLCLGFSFRRFFRAEGNFCSFGSVRLVFLSCQIVRDR